MPEELREFLQHLKPTTAKRVHDYFLQYDELALDEMVEVLAESIA